MTFTIRTALALTALLATTSARADLVGELMPDCAACVLANCEAQATECESPTDNVDNDPAGCLAINACVMPGYPDVDSCAYDVTDWGNGQLDCVQPGDDSLVHLALMLPLSQAQADGECAAEYFDHSGAGVWDLGITPMVRVLGRWMDTEFASGDFGQYAQCMRDNCSLECNLEI